MKQCRICGGIFELDDFHNNPAMSDGHFNECKVCKNRLSRERYLYKMSSFKPNSNGLKVCRRCGETKSCTEFYIHHATIDHYSHMCKSCELLLKEDYYNQLSADPNWLAQKRLRRKHRFIEENYASVRRYRGLYPEKIKANNAVCKIKKAKGTEYHHWSYLPENRRDVIIMSVKQHHYIHKYMIYDQEQRMFRGLNGVLLSTKSEHIEYINGFATEQYKISPEQSIIL